MEKKYLNNIETTGNPKIFHTKISVVFYIRNKIAIWEQINYLLIDIL